MEIPDTIVERLQCYEGINEEKAIGKFDEPLQMLCVELKGKSNSVNWPSLQTELHGQQFFSADPLLPHCNTKNLASCFSACHQAALRCTSGKLWIAPANPTSAAPSKMRSTPITTPMK